MYSLKDWIRDTMKRKGVGSFREVARQVSSVGDGPVTHATINRIMKENSASLPTLEKLAEWGGVSLSTLLDVCNTHRADHETLLERRISLLLQTYPDLRPAFERAFASLDEGVITQEDIAKIVEYTIFQVERHRERTSPGNPTRDRDPDREGGEEGDGPPGNLQSDRSGLFRSEPR